MAVPAGKKPVVLTFDDSSIGQFRYLDDGTVDPESAMGILLDFAEAHPDFPPVATFFPLLDVPLDERVLWGQPEYADQKLQKIIELGGEVGSHTVSHERLDQLGEERVRWQLAHSTQWLEERIGNGYLVLSLSLPLGAYPADEDWLRSGISEGASYAFTGAAEVAGGPAPSPFTIGFDPYHVFRIQMIPGYVDDIFTLIENQPAVQFVSDGHPRIITIPTEATLDPSLQGLFDATRWPQYTIVRYAKPQ
jgi:peptidoglycan/xylan/chitin deacetylase (PgdA/CDA1 family)